MPYERSYPVANYDDGEEDWEDDNDLEARQSGYWESQRKLSEGKDADLTELAAPAPVDPTRTRGDSLENEETEARRKQTHDPDSEDEELGLTEIAAPDPIERRRTHKDEENVQGADSPSDDSMDDQGLEKKLGQKVPEYSRAATEFYLHSHLVFFSILGTLARLGLEAITAYSDAPFASPVLWANLCGSFCIGFLTEDRKVFRQEWGSQSEEWSFHPSKLENADKDELQKLRSTHQKVKKTIPLFIGLAVGFCGSLTSFSSFTRDAFLAAINKLSSEGAGTNPGAISDPHRKGGYRFEATMAILIIQVAVSIGALNVGATTALSLDRWMPTLPFSLIRRLFDPLTVLTGFGCWIGAILMSIWPPENAWRGQAIFALVFAPLGCLLRFYLSKFLNTRLPSFPLGTFCANVLGTAILGMCYSLQHSDMGGTVTGCQVLVGVMEGFCGCLTTVSTWVLEMDTLRAKHAYIYGITSVSVAISFLVVVIGSLEWTRGLSTPACAG